VLERCRRRKMLACEKLESREDLNKWLGDRRWRPD
jgi:hypothetical protein